jgi:hypothetical protein
VIEVESVGKTEVETDDERADYRVERFWVDGNQ